MSITQVDQSKIMQLSPQSSQSLYFLRYKFNPEIRTDSPSGGVKQGWVGKTSYFLALCIDISKEIRPKLLLTLFHYTAPQQGRIKTNTT